jgi:hypothetical protein
MESHKVTKNPDFDDILALDKKIKEDVKKEVSE